jgi:hypothetical protein
MMSDRAGVPKQNPAFWIGCLVVVSFAAGIWAAFTPSVGPFIKPSVAGLMIIAGLVLLSPFATSRPINEHQRKVRKRISVIGGANIMVGVAQLLPNAWSSIALVSLAVLVMTAGAIAWSVHSGESKDPDSSFR